MFLTSGSEDNSKLPIYKIPRIEENFNTRMK